MYVILTSKPGQYHTDTDENLHEVEAYDYVFHSRKLAHFVIARLERDIKVRIVEESEHPAVNLVPSKFFPSFDTIEKARAELMQLSRFGSAQASLVRC
jgi:hypothetical protein